MVEADDASVTIEYSVDGESPESSTTRTHAWVDLRDHARFPAPHTSWIDEAIDTPLGRLECRRYTVVDGNRETRFWFAPGLPGAPVRMQASIDGMQVSEMELIERTLP